MAIIPIAISFILFYISNKYLNSNEYLHTYWSDFFVLKNFSNLPKLLFKNTAYTFNSIIPLLFIIATILTSFIKDNKNTVFYLLLFPVLISIILAYFCIYPFSTRLILYLIPIFILLSSKIFDFVNIKNKFIKIFIFFIGTFILIFPPAVESYVKILKKNYISENILLPLTTAAANADSNDIILISEGNKILYEYYRKYIKTNAQIIVEDTNYTNHNDYIKHLEQLEKGKTYYWILAHYRQKQQRLESIYKWAKEKKNFKIYVDKNLNTLIIFTN